MKKAETKKSRYIQAVRILADGVKKLHGPKCQTKSLFCPCCIANEVLDLCAVLASDMADVEKFRESHKKKPTKAVFQWTKTA